MGNATYGPQFHAQLDEVADRSARAVVPWLLDLPLTITSVLDVGCGTGRWAAVFAEHGVDVCGVDSPGVPVEMLRLPTEKFVARDLSEPLDLGRTFDLVVSLEVAEHVEPRAENVFMDTLTRHGHTVLFSAAIPGQGGTHHVNEQWPSYWEARFAERGYQLHDVVRPALWHREPVAHWYRQNTLLFASGKNSEAIGRLALAEMPVVDVVHPAMFAVASEPSLRSTLRRTVRRRLGRR